MQAMISIEFRSISTALTINFDQLLKIVVLLCMEVLLEDLPSCLFVGSYPLPNQPLTKQFLVAVLY
jgi:hypothetical protein